MSSLRSVRDHSVGAAISTDDAPDSSVGATRYSQTRKFLPTREEWRRVASDVLHSAAAVRSLSSVARALGVSSAAMDHWADRDHHSAMTLGDIMAAPRDWSEAVLVAALSHVRSRGFGPPMAPEVRALRVAAKAGEYAQVITDALADGKIGQEDVRKIVDALRPLLREAEAGIRDFELPRETRP